MITPKKDNIEKSLGKKTLDGLKYFGKNFWKVLPIGSAINYVNRVDKKLIEERHAPFIFHILYPSIGLTALAMYTFMGLGTDAWTSKQLKQYSERERIKQEIEKERSEEVNYFYNKMFENAESFQDSLDIYQEYGMPIKLLEPSLEKKEKVIKQNNELEKSVE